MSLIDRLLRRRKEGRSPTTSSGEGRPQGDFPWLALGVGTGVVLGLFLAILGVAWLLGSDKQATINTHQVTAGIPLALAPSRPEAAQAANEPTPDPTAEATVRPRLGLNVPAVSADAFAAISPVTTIEPLTDAPEASLLEAVGGRMLPRISPDGRTAWQAYGRPIARGEDRPRVVLIIGGLGLSRSATEAAIQRLPGAVTLAFDPYADDIAQWTRLARRNGHETLATLSFGAADFPFHNTGSKTLKFDEPLIDNLRRVDDTLAGAPGAVGVLAVTGSQFSQGAEAAIPILKLLKSRGLMLVDASGLHGSVKISLASKMDGPRVYVDVMLDTIAEDEMIDRQLAQLERRAHDTLVGVGLGRPLPVTFARIQAWAGKAEDSGFVLAPVSAVVGTQFLRDQ